jgi:hypothetical protein
VTACDIDGRASRPSRAWRPRSFTVGQREIRERRVERRRKARMDARTRQRAPVLQVLAPTADHGCKNAEALRRAGRKTRPRDTFTCAGETLTRGVGKSISQKGLGI